jgi:hypothetical protein
VRNKRDCDNIKSCDLVTPSQNVRLLVQVKLSLKLERSTTMSNTIALHVFFLLQNVVAI